MPLIVDHHIHSSYARATSKRLTLENIYKWCKIKGIDVIGTSDFTHPVWFQELQDKLEEAEPGLFTLKKRIAKKIDATLPQAVKNNEVRFMLVTEISSIYSKNNKVRRVHNLIFLPSFTAASKLIARLSKIGNLKADGRPILGLDSKELLKISLEVDEDSFFVPAHIWTPWFAMFGSKSGFDSIEEAFEELTPEIKAIETGLSSDPYMNWRVSKLDGLTLISGSDAHSLPKMAREANIIDCDLNYFDIIKAIKTGSDAFVGTIEFYPQEGMYHYDGHRKCNVRFKPSETKKHNGICPKCGKPLVVGVLNRIEELADRPEDFKPKKHKQVTYTIPLVEVIAELKGVKGINTKTVLTEYKKIYTALGAEFDIVLDIRIDEIRSAGFSELAESIERLRSGNVYIEPGYDGVYGTVKVYKDFEESKKAKGQIGLI